MIKKQFYSLNSIKSNLMVKKASGEFYIFLQEKLQCLFFCLESSCSLSTKSSGVFRAKCTKVCWRKSSMSTHSQYARVTKSHSLRDIILSEPSLS